MPDSPIQRAAFAAPTVRIRQEADGTTVVRHGLDLAPYDPQIGCWVRRWAATTPDRVALAEWSAAGTLRTLSYAQLRRAVDRLSQALLDRGLGAERPIALLSEKSVAYALMTLAALQIGVPISPISPAYSLRAEARGRLRYCLDVVRPGLILVEDRAAYADALALASPDAEVLTDDELEGIGVDPVSVDPAFASVDPDAVAKILFTSGSTGDPKPVINTHRMMCSNAQAQAQLFPFLTARSPVVVDWQPWHHCGGGNHNYHAALRNGGSYYIDRGKPTTAEAFAPTLRALSTISPTLHFNVPLGYERLTFHLERDPALAQSFFAELDCIVYSAASMPGSLWDRLETLSARHRGAGVPMVSSYGMTEMAPLHTSLHWHEGSPGMIGLPIPGSEVKLVPVDGKLELRAKGPNLTPGYYQSPDLTQAAFDEHGWYRSGDAVRFADPQDPARGLMFEGRLTDQFKLLSGSWVQLNRVRTDVLAATAPFVEDVLVTGEGRYELGLLVIANLPACRVMLQRPDLTLEALCADPLFREKLRAGLETYNLANPATSRRIARALAIVDIPSLGKGETTDKGHVNQSLALRNRAALVDRLYAADDPDVLVLAS